MVAGAVCATCAQVSSIEAETCDSIDCPTLYSRMRIIREYQDVAQLTADVLDMAAKQKRTRIEIV